MTIEEKAKAYDEALERAKQKHGKFSEFVTKTIEEIFPQLRESEDERIRRELIEYLRGDLDDITTDDTDRWITWIEKQKEQKPAEWSEEDEKKIGRLRSVVNQLASYTNSLDVNGDYCEGDYAELDAWLKSLRPSWKPSEDQMDALKELIDDANRAGWVTPGATELYEQLKKL